MLDKKMIPVLAGGGTRLPAHVGILTALEQMGYRVEQLVDVSGGSIVVEHTIHHEYSEDDTPVVYFRVHSTREAGQGKASPRPACLPDHADPYLHNQYSSRTHQRQLSAADSTGRHPMRSAFINLESCCHNRLELHPGKPARLR
jgi:hypothetical protein